MLKKKEKRRKNLARFLLCLLRCEDNNSSIKREREGEYDENILSCYMFICFRENISFPFSELERGITHGGGSQPRSRRLQRADGLEGSVFGSRLPRRPVRGRLAGAGGQHRRAASPLGDRLVCIDTCPLARLLWTGYPPDRENQ